MIDRRIPPALCCALLLVMCGPHRLHAACAGTVQGEGRVSAVLDARTLRLDDGREVRLAGIEIPDDVADRGTDVLASLIAGRDVTLHGRDDRPDRYGRQPSFIFAGNAALPVQAELISRGMAFWSGSATDRTCSGALLAAEAVARDAGRGIWAGSAALKNAERTDDILARRGRFAVVEGTISSARLAGATFYVNFSRQWTRGFAVTISRRMMPSFEAAGIDLKSLKDKRIRVRGWIEAHGGPRIAAIEPGQIEVMTVVGTASKGEGK